MSQSENAARFRALHDSRPLVLANAWDAGSARVLEQLGFKALATTSAGLAWTLGRADTQVTRDQVLGGGPPRSASPIREREQGRGEPAPGCGNAGPD